MQCSECSVLKPIHRVWQRDRSLPPQPWLCVKIAVSGQHHKIMPSTETSITKKLWKNYCDKWSARELLLLYCSGNLFTQNHQFFRMFILRTVAYFIYVCFCVDMMILLKIKSMKYWWKLLNLIFLKTTNKIHRIKVAFVCQS